MKNSKDLIFLRKMALRVVRAASSFWMPNKHWFYTLFFVIISLYVVHEWYTYQYNMEGVKSEIKEQLLQNEYGEFDVNKFDSVLKSVQNRKTDFYRGIQVERDIFQ